MKFTGQNGTLKCGRKELHDTLKTLNQTTTRSRPVLQAVRIECTTAGVSLITSNLDTSTYHSADLDGDVVEMKVLVPCDKLISFCSDDRGDSVCLQQNNLALESTLECAGETVSSMVMPVFDDIENYPCNHTDVLPLDGDPVSGELLHQAIEKVSPAVAKNAVQYAMTGMNVRQNGDQIELAGTDTHRLHVGTLPGRMNIDDSGVVMVQFMRVVANSCGDYRVVLAVEGNQIKAQYGPWTIIGQLIQGKFPRYMDIVNSAFSEQRGRWSVPRVKMIKAIKACIPFVEVRDRSIVVDFCDQITLSACDENIAKICTHVTATNSPGEKQTICLTAQYLVDALNTTDAEDVTFYVLDDRSPVGFAAEPGCNVVIMPVARG